MRNGDGIMISFQWQCLSFGNAPWPTFRSESGERFEQFNFQQHVRNQIYENLLKVTGGESDVDATTIINSFVATNARYYSIFRQKCVS